MAYNDKDIQSFVDHVGRLCVKGGTQFPQCFENFLDLQLQFFCNNVNARQKELFTYMKEHESFRKDMSEAMQILGDLSEGYHDVLGEIFMSRITHGENGQFFTPEAITEMMTQVIQPT